MKAWSLIWGWILVVLVAACGISDGGPGGNVPKDDDELSIADVTISALSDTSATLSWKTTVQAVSTLFYGQEASALAYTKASPLGATHEIHLDGLTEDTEYHYQVTAADGFGKQVSTEEATFRTLPAADLDDATPPIIRNVRATGITPRAATITWETDDRAIGEVRFGTSATNLTRLAPTGSDYRRAQAVVLDELTASTEYFFQVRAVNRAQGASTSAVGTFTTGNDPTLFIYPENVVISAGSTTTFEVRIEDAENVAGLGFHLNIQPPSALEIITIAPGPYASSNGGGHVFLPRYPTLTPPAADATWMIEFDGGVPVGTAAGSEGVVARITCRGRALSESGTITFRLLPLDAGEGEEYDENNPENETRLLDHNRQVMPVNVRNATLIVN